MILKIRVAEAPVVMIAAHSAYGISAAVLTALIAAVLAGIAVVEAQAAVLTEVIRIVRVHCAHSLGAVGVALAALLAHLAGFAELVLVLLIRDPAVAALTDVLVPLGAFHAGLAVRAAAALGVISAALKAQAAGGAVRFLHAVGALVALIAPIDCIEQTLTTIVAVEFSEAVGVAVNSAEPTTVAHILTPVVVVAVDTICALVVVLPKGMGMKFLTRHQ